jgi:hypothetical protein
MPVIPKKTKMNIMQDRNMGTSWFPTRLAINMIPERLQQYLYLKGVHKPSFLSRI